MNDDGPAAPPCGVCGQPATRLCDYPIGAAEVDEYIGGWRDDDGVNHVEKMRDTTRWHTCDLPMCASCTNQQWSTLPFHGYDAIDHCAIHQPGMANDEVYRVPLEERRMALPSPLSDEQADGLRGEIRDMLRKLLADRARVPLTLVTQTTKAPAETGAEE